MLKLTQANSANCMQNVEVSLQGNRLRQSQLYECKTSKENKKATGTKSNGHIMQIKQIHTDNNCRRAIIRIITRSQGEMDCSVDLPFA